MNSPSEKQPIQLWLPANSRITPRVRMWVRVLSAYGEKPDCWSWCKMPNSSIKGLLRVFLGTLPVCLCPLGCHVKCVCVCVCVSVCVAALEMEAAGEFGDHSKLMIQWCFCFGPFFPSCCSSVRLFHTRKWVHPTIIIWDLKLKQSLTKILDLFAKIKSSYLGVFWSDHVKNHQKIKSFQTFTSITRSTDDYLRLKLMWDQDVFLLLFADL